MVIIRYDLRQQLDTQAQQLFEVETQQRLIRCYGIREGLSQTSDAGGKGGLDVVFKMLKSQI